MIFYPMIVYFMEMDDFEAGFFIGSISGFPVGLKKYILDVSSWCLVTAIAAIGMKTALASLKTVGGQAITIICVETVLLALFVLLAIHLFIV